MMPELYVGVVNRLLCGEPTVNDMLSEIEIEGVFSALMKVSRTNRWL